MAVKVIREVVADVVKRGATRAVYAKQHDRNSRFLNVRIQEDGRDIKVDSTAAVVLNVERPDKAENMFFGTVNTDGTVQVPLHPWMLTLEGTLLCDISIISQDTDIAKLTTMQFNIYVEAAVVEDGEISEEDEEYSIVVELIAKAGALGAELDDARTGYDGTVYESVGDAIRDQVQKVKPKSVTPDALDREYVRLEEARVLGTSFYNFLVSHLEEAREPDKKMFLLSGDNSGVFETIGSGRCVGFYASSSKFNVQNLLTGKQYLVAFNEQEITSVEEINLFELGVGNVTPDNLDRTYLEARSTGTLTGDAFHNFLISGIKENGDHLKTIHLFVSRGDGILEAVGVGRCKGFYVNSTQFTFENLNTNKVYQVVFTAEGITSITEKYADIADASILRKHLSDSLLIPDKMLEESYWKIKGYSSVISYADLDAVFDDEDLYDTIYQFKFSGLSPMAELLGSDDYIAIASSETYILILINRTNGDRWSYEKGSDTLTAIGSSGTAEEASFGTTTWDTFSPVSTTGEDYVFSHIGASISGELKSISVKCDAVATVKFAIAHMENGVVSSVDDIYITTKVGENTYVNGVDFYYDGTIQKGDLIGYCRDISCKIYYGTSEDEWCYRTAGLTDYTLTAKTYGFAISAVVETKGYENRIVTLENDVAALKQNKASSILEVIGTEIDPSIANYADSEKFVIRLTPSTADATLTMEKSEDVNTSAVRQICYVDFTNGKMGFFKRCADGAAPAIYQKKAISFSIVSGHEYVVEMIKEDSKYAILRITDALSLESDEISCSEFEVGRGWGSRKYDYTGDAGDITSVKSYIMQNKKTKLLIVGDSYIEGSSLPEFGEDRNNRYAMLLKNAVGGDCFINGRGGAASADMLSWFNTYLPDVCQPEYTIISCGANDSNYENWLARYQSIIAKIEEMGSKPILTTVAAISVSASKDIFGQMNEWIRNSGYDYIDVNLVTSLDYGMTELNPDYFFSDNAHPNSVGHDIIFKRAQIDVPYVFRNNSQTASREYVDNRLGDIDTALDELHTYAQGLISGGASE